MNYLDINSLSNQVFKININLEDSIVTTADILWTIYKDGSDTPVVVFDNSDGHAQVTVNGYYHALSLDISEIAFDEELVDETQYTLEGWYSFKTVYKGKFQTTSKDLNDFSVNQDKYKKQSTNNNYTILS